MDNPCLSRGLIADYGSSQCYKTTSTILTRYGGWYKSTWLGTISDDMGGNGYKTASNGTNGCNLTINGSYSLVGIGSSHNWNDAIEDIYCNEKSRTYTCPVSHPTKLNNSTCKYSESF